MEFERATLEMDGGVAVLRMNHPDVLNALSPEMLKGMNDALDAIAAADTRVRCLVLTGTGRAFSTGANLRAAAATARCRAAPGMRSRPCSTRSSGDCAICPFHW